MRSVAPSLLRIAVSVLCLAALPVSTVSAQNPLWQRLSVQEAAGQRLVVSRLDNLVATASELRLSLLGFRSRAELRAAVVGDGYPVLYVDEDRVGQATEAARVRWEELTVSSDETLYPLLLEGQIRSAMVTTEASSGTASAYDVDSTVPLAVAAVVERLKGRKPQSPTQLVLVRVLGLQLQLVGFLEVVGNPLRTELLVTPVAPVEGMPLAPGEVKPLVELIPYLKQALKEAGGAPGG